MNNFVTNNVRAHNFWFVSICLEFDGLTLALILLSPRIVICKACISPVYSGIDGIVHNFKPHFIKFAEYQ